MSVFTSPPPAHGAEWSALRAGPVRDHTVLWVGHSLVEGKAPIDGSNLNLMQLVARFAAARSSGYVAGDHTKFGSSLAALWNGKPHTYQLDAAAGMEKLRAEFERDAMRYTALVATEVLPLRPALRAEFSSFYLRRFACTLVTANPKARVYLFESWVRLNGVGEEDGNRTLEGWFAKMREQQADWEKLATEASGPSVRSPGLLARVGLPNTSDAGCKDHIPIYAVPVGRAFLRLAEQLQTDAGDRYKFPDGRRLTIEDLYLNPYPLTSQPAAPRRPRDPAKDVDDIHQSSIGLYLNGLVHFATLYRQTPVGLPALSELGPKASRDLQCLAWETVLATPRSGVSGSPAC